MERVGRNWYSPCGWPAVPDPGKDLAGMPTEAQFSNLAVGLSPRSLWKALGEEGIGGGRLFTDFNCFNRFLKLRASYPRTNPAENVGQVFQSVVCVLLAQGSLGMPVVKTQAPRPHSESALSTGSRWA